MLKAKIAGCFVALGLSMPLFAAPVALDEEHWTLTGDGTEFTEHMGRKAIKIKRGRATLQGMEFQNGVIEYDVLMPRSRGFAGVEFRMNDDNGEKFYMRSHQSGNPDANQYTPLFNGSSAWQIYYGTQYSTPVEYQFDIWTHVKLVVKNSKMDVYIDSDEPVLHVDNLLQDDVAGLLSLTGSFSDFYFSNVSIENSNDVVLRGKASAMPDLPKGIVSEFSVAQQPVESSRVEGKAMLDPMLVRDQVWQTLKVERNGIANLARVHGGTRKNDTLLAKLSITAEEDKTVFLKYGFSDRVTVFHNGTAIAHGDDIFRSRDYRFLGTVGLYDGVFLPLKKGENEIVFAVTEVFGGWAVAAAIENRSGIRVN